MQIGLLAIAGTGIGLCVRRMAQWRHLGCPNIGRRLYVQASWCAGLLAWLGMITQEILLMMNGQLSLRTGLPLHLCSASGVLLLPMLLTRNRFLWHVSLYAGIPGALLALAFPAVASSPWQQWMTVAFMLMHCMVALAPLLPLGLGMRPEPVGAVHALLFLLGLAAADLAVNRWLGSNYLFLSLPARGTPLAVLAANGVWPYRLLLLLLCMVLLAAEGGAVYLWKHRRSLR